MKCAEIHLTQRKEHDEVGWLGHQQTLYYGSMKQRRCIYYYVEPRKKNGWKLSIIYWLGMIGILIMVCYNPCITGSKMPYITQATRFFCGSCIYPSFLQKIANIKASTARGPYMVTRNLSSSSDPNSTMWFFNGDESHGRIRKKYHQTNKSPSLESSNLN